MTIALLLARHRDKAKIADRGANRLGLTINHHDLQATSGSGKGVAQPQYARANNG